MEKLAYQHIGKTGGTSFREAVLSVKGGFQKFNCKNYQHRGHFNYNVPTKVVFAVRDPIARMMSGYYCKWVETAWAKIAEEEQSKEMALPFNEFVNHWRLGTGELGDWAVRLRQKSIHLGKLCKWYGDIESFKNNLEKVEFILFQETLSEDFKSLKNNVERFAELPDIERKNKNPTQYDTTISEKNHKFLTEFFAQDYEFIQECENLMHKKTGRPFVRYSPDNHLGYTVVPDEAGKVEKINVTPKGKFLYITQTSKERYEVYKPILSKLKDLVILRYDKDTSHPLDTHAEVLDIQVSSWRQGRQLAFSIAKNRSKDYDYIVIMDDDCIMDFSKFEDQVSRFDAPLYYPSYEHYAWATKDDLERLGIHIDQAVVCYNAKNIHEYEVIQNGWFDSYKTLETNWWSTGWISNAYVWSHPTFKHFKLIDTVTLCNHACTNYPKRMVKKEREDLVEKISNLGIDSVWLNNFKKRKNKNFKPLKTYRALVIKLRCESFEEVKNWCGVDFSFSKKKEFSYIDNE